MSVNPRTIAVWVALILVFFGFYQRFSPGRPGVDGHRSLEQLRGDFGAERVKQLEVDKAGTLFAVMLGGARYVVDAPPAEVFEALEGIADRVPYYEASEQTSPLSGWQPLVAVALFWASSSSSSVA